MRVLMLLLEQQSYGPSYQDVGLVNTSLQVQANLVSYGFFFSD